MWRSTRWGEREGTLCMVALALVSLPQVGFAEQPLTQLPDDVASFSLAWVALPQAVIEVTKGQGPLAGVSWGVIKGSSEVVGRILNLVDENPSFARTIQTPRSQGVVAYGDEARSPAWLNVDHGESRQARHEPALLRYTF